MGAWLGLPVGVKLAWGWDDPDWNWFGDVSVFEKEALSGIPYGDEFWGLDVLVSFGMFELELAGNPGATGDLGDFAAGVAVKEPIPGLNAEFYLYQNGPTTEDWDAMRIALGAGYGGSFGDFDMEAGVNFAYDMGAEAWDSGVALTGAFSMIYADVALTGNDVDALDDLYLYLTAAPIDLKPTLT